MLNKLWPILIIISIIYAIFFGNLEIINKSIFESTEDTIKLTLSLLGSICLWNGIMNIAKNTKIINIIKRFLKPILRFLFPDIDENDEVNDDISMNIIANIMGLGNAATPLGLKAMNSLQEKNKNKKILSNSMAILIVINTASLQIIPTTILAVRNSLGSTNPSEIIVPVWISSLLVAVFVVVFSKTLMKKY